MEIVWISEEEFEEATKSTGKKGELQQILDEIEAKGQPCWVPRATRGSVSSLVRAARERGFTAHGDYKNLRVYIKPK